MLRLGGSSKNADGQVVAQEFSSLCEILRQHKCLHNLSNRLSVSYFRFKLPNKPAAVGLYSVFVAECVRHELYPAVYYLCQQSLQKGIETILVSHRNHDIGGILILPVLEALEDQVGNMNCRAAGLCMDSNLPGVEGLEAITEFFWSKGYCFNLYHFYKATQNAYKAICYRQKLANYFEAVIFPAASENFERSHLSPKERGELFETTQRLVISPENFQSCPSDAFAWSIDKRGVREFKDALSSINPKEVIGSGRSVLLFDDNKGYVESAVQAWQHLGFDQKHLRTSSNLSWVTRAMRGKNVGAFITDLFVNPEVARSAPELFKPLTQAISEILTKASGVPILEEELKILCGIDRP